MSAYSILNITKQKALSIYLQDQINFEDIDSLIGSQGGTTITITIPTEAELELFMDNYLESSLYNCNLVSSDDDINEDWMI
jgi:hypothetical protein